MNRVGKEKAMVAGRGRAKALLAVVGLGLAGREVIRRTRDSDLSGQVALVTGGSRGLGYLLARELAREGCRIVICARDEVGLERARADLERQGAEVLAVSCDVADRAQVKRMVEQATSHFGRIDVLVNNAGIILVGPAESMTIENYEDAMGIMYWGTVYATLAVLPQMRERRSGRIVNITSVGGKVSVPHLIPYNCAKFAATAFSEGLGAELTRDGIAVTTICPGVMRTGSYLNIALKGQQRKEFLWFALASSLPLASMDAERAARQIVRAARRGDTERILSTQANLLARFHGLLPGTTVELLGIANRFLPSTATGGAETGTARSMEVQRRMRSPLLRAATLLGRSAARRFHELPRREREQ